MVGPGAELDGSGDGSFTVCSESIPMNAPIRIKAAPEPAARATLCLRVRAERFVGSDPVTRLGFSTAGHFVASAPAAQALHKKEV